MEESKAELDFLVKEAYWRWQRNQTEEHRMIYDILQERLIAWKQKHRGTHLKWIAEKEALGHETHQWVLAHGPKHPNSYLLYNDGGTLIFPRDHQDRYASYSFWLQHLTDEEPIDHLGKDYFSAKELGVHSATISEYYQLQQIFLKGHGTERDTGRLQALRDEIQAAYNRIPLNI